MIVACCQWPSSAPPMPTITLCKNWPLSDLLLGRPFCVGSCERLKRAGPLWDLGHSSPRHLDPPGIQAWGHSYFYLLVWRGLNQY